MTTASIKLDDLHLIMLSTASRRADGSVLPIAKSVRAGREQIDAAVAALLAAGMLEEQDDATARAIWRQDGDVRTSLPITDAGLALIDKGGTDRHEFAQSSTASAPAGLMRTGSKSALLVDLLNQPDGASLDAIIAATGWLPHTTRAAISGLRKRGFAVHNSRADGVSRYSIGAA